MTLDEGSSLAGRLQDVGVRNARAFVLVGVSLALLAPGCDNPVEVTPQSVTATGRATGTDGTGASASPVSVTLTNNPGTSSPRVASASGGLQNVTGVDLNVVRSGIPIAESYYLMNISQPTLHPDGNDINSSVASGTDATFVRRNIGDLSEGWVDTALLDATLTYSFSDFPPAAPNGETSPVRLSGSTFLARIEEDDVFLPFSDPSLLIDVSRIAGSFFTALSGAITTAATGTTAFALGGNDGAGDFRMHFVPHTTHSTVTLPARNVKGFAFIFGTTITVFDPLVNTLPIGTAHVYIPVSVLLEPDATVEAPFRVFADPFSMLGSSVNPPDNLARILVIADGFLQDQIATTVLSTITGAIETTSADTLSTLDTALDLLAAALDGALPESVDELPEDFDVILVPESSLGGVARNQILPAAGAIPVKLYILQ